MTLVLSPRGREDPATPRAPRLLAAYLTAPLLPSIATALAVRKMAGAAASDLAPYPHAEIAAFLNGVIGYGYLPALLLGAPMYFGLRHRLPAVRLQLVLKLALAAPFAVFVLINGPLLYVQGAPRSGWALADVLVWTFPFPMAWIATLIFDIVLLAPGAMDRPARAPAAPSPAEATRTVRFLAAISVLLAVMCAGITVAWVQAHDRVIQQRQIIECYRSVAEEDRVPQDRECAL